MQAAQGAATAGPLPHARAHSPPVCSLLPCLPPALEVLLNAQADACDVADVLLLLNQLLARFKEALAPVMQVGGVAGGATTGDGMPAPAHLLHAR